MPAFLLPIAFTALLALAIPLAIHLARRSEAVLTDFAALQWLRQKPRPKSRIRFDEIPLLIARLLLLTLLALWLARPVLPNSADSSPVTAAVPGVDAGAPAPNTRNIWLVPGFPPYSEPQGSRLAATDSPPASLTSLIRDLDSQLPPGVPLTLIIPETLQDIDAQRPILSRPVTWKIAPGAMPAAAPVAQPVPKLDIREARSPALRPLRAAATAWTTPNQPPAFTLNAPDTPLPSPQTTLVWLPPGPLPPQIRDWITSGGTALATHETPAEPGESVTLWRDSATAPLVDAQKIGAGRLLRFTRPLTAAATPDILRPDFPQKLAAILTPPPAQPARVMAIDIAPATGAAPWPQPARDLQPWLALLIAAAFLIERWLATRSARAPAP